MTQQQPPPPPPSDFFRPGAAWIPCPPFSQILDPPLEVSLTNQNVENFTYHQSNQQEIFEITFHEPLFPLHFIGKQKLFADGKYYVIVNSHTINLITTDFKNHYSMTKLSFKNLSFASFDKLTNIYEHNNFRE